MSFGHSHDDLTSRSTAIERVLEVRDRALSRQHSETVPLTSIDGRVLTKPVRAATDAPDRDYAVMDGYVLDATEDYPLTVADAEVFPESEPPTVPSGHAVPIATGAPLPTTQTQC